MIPNAPWVLDHAFIQQQQIDLVVHGDDCTQDQLNYTNSVALEKGIFRAVPYTHGISTSDLIQRVIAAQSGPNPTEPHVYGPTQKHQPVV